MSRGFFFDQLPIGEDETRVPALVKRNVNDVNSAPTCSEDAQCSNVAIEGMDLLQRTPTDHQNSAWARSAVREQQVRYDITWPISGLIRLFFLFKLVQDLKPKRKSVYVYRKNIKGPQAPSINEGL